MTSFCHVLNVAVSSKTAKSMIGCRIIQKEEVNQK